MKIPYNINYYDFQSFAGSLLYALCLGGNSRVCVCAFEHLCLG